MVTKAAKNLNGITIAYVMGVANALFALMLAYGVHLTDAEIASTLAFINTVLVLAVHVGHRVGEATASGSAAERSAQSFATQPQPQEPQQTG